MLREAVDAARLLGLHAGDGADLPQLAHAYRAAHERVLADLDSHRYHELMAALEAVLTAPPLRKRAQAPAGKVLPRLVGRSYDRVRRDVKQAHSLPAGAERDERLHDARKAAKQARYAGEAVAPVFGKDADRFAAAGADTVVLQPTADDPDPEGFIRFVAQEVRPLVQ